MKSLLDAADTLAAAIGGSNEPQKPDFQIPEPYTAVPTQEYLELVVTPNKGRGWRARQDLPAGTLLIMAKPIAMVMDWEDDSGENMEDEDENEEEQEPRMNELLLLALLARIRKEPTVWTHEISDLFPRTEDVSHLPAWVCNNDEVFFEVEAEIQQIEKIEALSTHAKDISRRLPLIIRYNVLSVETCSELLSYPGPNGHTSLSGVGLFHLPSFFNHSSRPNCSRWAIGDVMGFVANQNIHAGQEVCISYLEHDVLCESAYRRNQMLKMDFFELLEGEQIAPPSPVEEQGPELPVVDSDVQNELMGMETFERLSAIDELMQQATGLKLPPISEEGADPSVERIPSTWFQCDVQNLRIIKAITLDGMGQSKQAIQLWEDAVHFCESYLPPNDESVVVVHVQAALCAHHIGGRDAQARAHAAEAVRVHNLLFGGGVQVFRRRCKNDLELEIRPRSNDFASTIDLLWPIVP